MPDPPPSRLARRLGLADAVVIGLGSMIGAGVFSAIGPAAAAAGGGLLVGLAIAGLVAYANATSSAALAARYPASGGTYVYGREQLGAAWGNLAGGAFIVGKTASCAGMALTIGAAVAPSTPRPVAVAAVLAVTIVNSRGIRKTAGATRALLAIVLAVLFVAVVAMAVGGSGRTGEVFSSDDLDVYGILQAAGLLFFAFAGYARIATLGEEVDDPATTIPKAIPRALGITLAVYAAVVVSALAAVGPVVLGGSTAPLATAVAAGDLAGLAPLIRAGAVVASLGVLLSLVAGIGRTMFAMAADAVLPRWLAAVHPRHQVPHRADLVIGVAVAALVGVSDLRGAIGFSSFCVLAYYAITNASAFTLAPEHRRWPRPLAAFGLLGCVVLMVTLPARSVVMGGGVLAVVAAVSVARRSTGTRRPTAP